jgi:hypothetical protein
LQPCSMIFAGMLQGRSYGSLLTSLFYLFSLSQPNNLAVEDFSQAHVYFEDEPGRLCGQPADAR